MLVNIQLRIPSKAPANKLANIDKLLIRAQKRLRVIGITAWSYKYNK